MAKIFEMFMGASGKVSAMRVASLSIAATIMAVFVAHNVMSIVRGNCGFVTIPWESASLILGVLGVKAYQQKNENGKTVGEEEEAEPAAVPEPPKDAPKNEIP
jgi:hypothetical protein